MQHANGGGGHSMPKPGENASRQDAARGRMTQVGDSDAFPPQGPMARRRNDCARMMVIAIASGPRAGAQTFLSVRRGTRAQANHCLFVVPTLAFPHFRDAPLGLGEFVTTEPRGYAGFTCCAPG